MIGKRYIKCYIVCLLFAINAIAQNQPPEINVTGNQLYCPEAPIPIVLSADITDPDPEDMALSQIFIQISGGYKIGQDLLTLGGVNPNITAIWSEPQGQLTLQGPASFTDFENAIENVFFETTETVFTQDREFSINLSDGKFLPSTGHFYVFVEAEGISWSEARDAAAAQTYFGFQGYLATLTIEEEAQFAGEQTSGTGWIGATDEETEGTWKWVTGPEAGLVFWIGEANGGPPNNEYSFWNTNEPNDLNGEDYAHITAPSIGIPGSWNDLPLSNTNSSDPYYPKGYIVEFGGFADDPDINISDTSIVRMPRISSEDVSVCGDNNVIISVDVTTDEVFWYETETSTTVIHTGNDFETSLSGTTTFWLNPFQEFCTEGYEVRYPVTVIVNPFPEANDITISQCDDAIMDGSTRFNLEIYKDAINASNNVTIDFFEDVALTNSINTTTDYSNLSNPQTIYALVTDSGTMCTSVAEVILEVDVNNASFSAELTQCDTDDEDGFTIFDLSEAETQFTNNMGNVEVMGFYETYDDALLLKNELTNNYTNTVAYNQTIFARLVENGRCFGVSEIDLIVQPLPILSADDTVFYCLNTFPQPIILNAGVIDNDSSDYDYEWSTGAITESININEIGTYSVKVTTTAGCPNTRTITVLPSNIATFETIEVTDISDNNIITVLVSGDGDYVYALDDENGTYQSSNTFENVTAGIHTVFVKDIKNDCGTVAEAVSVLGFPRFFTPNGDGNNDTWEIKGFSTNFPVTSVIEIYDRYGKLITILNANNPRWDGRFNGKTLPTDDYWFLAKLIDGRTVRDHFTLKH